MPDAAAVGSFEEMRKENFWNWTGSDKLFFYCSLLQFVIRKEGCERGSGNREGGLLAVDP